MSWHYPPLPHLVSGWVSTLVLSRCWSYGTVSIAQGQALPRLPPRPGLHYSTQSGLIQSLGSRLKEQHTSFWIYTAGVCVCLREKVRMWNQASWLESIIPALEAEVRGLLQVQGQPGLYIEFQASQYCNRETLSQDKTKTKQQKNQECAKDGFC